MGIRTLRDRFFRRFSGIDATPSATTATPSRSLKIAKAIFNKFLYAHKDNDNERNTARLFAAITEGDNRCLLAGAAAVSNKTNRGTIVSPVFAIAHEENRGRIFGLFIAATRKNTGAMLSGLLAVSDSCKNAMQAAVFIVQVGGNAIRSRIFGLFTIVSGILEGNQFSLVSYAKKLKGNQFSLLANICGVGSEGWSVAPINITLIRIGGRTFLAVIPFVWKHGKWKRGAKKEGAQVSTGMHDAKNRFHSTSKTAT